MFWVEHPHPGPQHQTVDGELDPDQELTALSGQQVRLSRDHVKIVRQPPLVAEPCHLDLSLRDANVLGPLSAAFVERFTVGLIIVTFALFATKTHGLSDRSIGLLYSMLMLPFALLMYPASRLGDRMPRAALLGVGTLLYGAAITSLALAPKALLPVSMMAAGIASSFMYGTVLCYAATLVPAEMRGRMMALVNTAGALGMLLGPMCGGIMVATFRNQADPLSAYRNVFYLAGAVCIAWVIIQGPWLFKRLETERGEHALATQASH